MTTLKIVLICAAGSAFFLYIGYWIGWNMRDIEAERTANEKRLQEMADYYG